MLVSYAVVRSEPPEVFLADDIETLQWVLALKVVAKTPSRKLDAATLTGLRAALLAERWAEAVFGWIEATGIPIDVYPEFQVYTPSHVAMAHAELQFTPLFQDEA